MTGPHLFSLWALAGTACAWEAPLGNGWQKGVEPPWAAHTGSIATSLSNGTILLLGGQRGDHGGGQFDASNCTSQVYSFEVEEEKWTDFSEGVPWSRRWGHSAVTMPDDTVWMLFGCCEPGQRTVMFRDVWSWNPVKGVPWTKMQTDPPFEGVEATSVAVRGDDLWVVGGWSQSRGTLSQVAVLSTKTLEWTEKSETHQVAWQTRANHATAISPDGQWLFVFGGQHRASGTGIWSRIGDAWRVRLPEASTSAWEEIGGLQSGRASPPAVYLPNGWLLTAGGHWVREHVMAPPDQPDEIKKIHDALHETSLKTLNDVHVLDMKNGGEDGWKLVEDPAPWIDRDDQAAVAAKGNVMIFGGGRKYGGGGYLQDVWRLPNVLAAYKLEGGPGVEL